MDNDVTRDYFDALELEPRLVERETPKINFLRTDDFDSYSAANRLARYWKYRRQLFFERWLLPINLTGKGALNVDEVEIIKTGYLVMSVDSVHGDVFGLIDISRLPVWNSLAVERIAFYWIAVFAQESVQLGGFRFVHAISSAPRPQVAVDNQAWEMVLKAFHCRVKGITIAKTYEEGRQPLIDFYAEYTSLVLSQNERLPIRSLEAGSTQGNLQLLLQDGVSRQFLPKYLGGTYDYSQFDEWIRSRITIEDAMSSAPPVLNSSLWGRQEDAKALKDERKASKKTPVEVDQRAAVYSKRYHHRKKMKEINLQDEKIFLRDQHDMLKRENQRLRGLLDQARELVASLEEDDDADTKPAADESTAKKTG